MYSNENPWHPQNARRPPSGIPPTVKGTVLHVDLILGSFTRASSTVPLFNLKLPASMPVPPHPEESMYNTRPTIYHTFRGEPRTPPKSISLIFVVLALSPWVLLVTLVCRFQPADHSGLPKPPVALPLTCPLQSNCSYCTLHRRSCRIRGFDCLVLG